MNELEILEGEGDCGRLSAGNGREEIGGEEGFMALRLFFAVEIVVSIEDVGFSLQPLLFFQPLDSRPSLSQVNPSR